MPDSKPCVPILLLTLAALGCRGDAEPAVSTTRDSAAVAWHDSVMAAMGGAPAWDRARYITFRWNVLRDGEVVSDRRHHWDRRRGRYRLETVTGDGDSLLALFDVGDRTGRVWIGGEPVEGARGDSLVERAYAMFINDTYWLLMPYKWRDPGVNLEYQGTRTDSAGTWHVVHLTFQDVGLTPGDRYWAYVSAEPPHLMRQWQYHLQGQEEPGPVIRWDDWRDFGPIRLATERNPVGSSGFGIRFREIEVSTEVPGGIFDPPDR